MARLTIEMSDKLKFKFQKHCEINKVTMNSIILDDIKQRIKTDNFKIKNG